MAAAPKTDVETTSPAAPNGVPITPGGDVHEWVDVVNPADKSVGRVTREWFEGFGKDKGWTEAK